MGQRLKHIHENPRCALLRPHPMLYTAISERKHTNEIRYVYKFINSWCANFNIIAEEDLYQFIVLDSRNSILICFIDADELKSLEVLLKRIYLSADLS